MQSHYLNQCNIVNWTLGNKLQWSFNPNLYIFTQENAFETVICEIAAILSRPQYVSSLLRRLGPIRYGNGFIHTFQNIVNHNPVFSWWIYLQICREHGSMTAMLSAKLQTDLLNKIGVVDGYFVKFKFHMKFPDEQTGKLTHGPWGHIAPVNWVIIGSGNSRFITRPFTWANADYLPIGANI